MVVTFEVGAIRRFRSSLTHRKLNVTFVMSRPIRVHAYRKLASNPKRGPGSIIRTRTRLERVVHENGLRGE